nr:hypothetical protein [Morchella crassipes]
MNYLTSSNKPNMKFTQITFLRAFATVANVSQPVRNYYSPDTWKKQLPILAENKNKPGVYRWVNQVNHKSYVGASASLTNRLKHYFSSQSLTFFSLSKRERKKNRVGSDLVINRAILKHTLTNFNLEILAYCALADLAKKERYYISKYQPEYNLNLKG